MMGGDPAGDSARRRNGGSRPTLRTPERAPWARDPRTADRSARIKGPGPQRAPVPRRKYGHLRKPIPPVPSEKCRLCRLQRPCPAHPAGSSGRGPCRDLPGAGGESADLPRARRPDSTGTHQPQPEQCESTSRRSGVSSRAFGGQTPRAEPAEDADVRVDLDHAAGGPVSGAAAAFRVQRATERREARERALHANGRERDADASGARRRASAGRPPRGGFP